MASKTLARSVNLRPLPPEVDGLVGEFAIDDFTLGAVIDLQFFGFFTAHRLHHRFDFDLMLYAFTKQVAVGQEILSLRG